MESFELISMRNAIEFFFDRFISVIEDGESSTTVFNSKQRKNFNRNGILVQQYTGAIGGSKLVFTATAQAIYDELKREHIDEHVSNTNTLD